MQQSEAGKLGGHGRAEKLTAEEIRQMSSKAGRACLKKHGKGHYKDMGQRSAEVRVPRMTEEDRREFGERMAEARRKARAERKRREMAEKLQEVRRRKR